MSRKWKAHNESAYFCTITVLDWMSIFKDEKYCKIILESLKFCQKEKDLEIFSYCLMPNHLHLILRQGSKDSLPAIIRDFKKFTSRRITEELKTEKRVFYKICLRRMRLSNSGSIKKYKFWQDGYHAVELYSPKVVYQKLQYIHMNPVKAGIADCPENYRWSSARNYVGMAGEINVILIR